MLRLYDSAFSPFARKVRLVLEHKNIPCEFEDGLRRTSRDALARVNGRVEVPALDHDGVIVINSSDIVAYLERIQLEPAVYPKEPALFARARAWERCADSVIDPILINISYWHWADRDDQRPEAWLAAAQRDLNEVYDALERDLGEHAFVCGKLSIADMALFPHLVAARLYRLGHDPKRHPHVDRWLKHLRELPIFAADLARAKAFMRTFVSANAHERRKIFWRGDRVEWLLANGFHAWFVSEIEADRVLWPGLGVPNA